MKATLSLCILLVLVLPSRGAPATKRPVPWETPKLTLDRIPVVNLPPEPQLTSAEVTEIKQRIRNLAKIDSPDFGLSPTLSGHAFAPVAGAREASPMLLTSHNIKTSEDLLALVKLGPKALPSLLEAMEDPTPTKLTVSSQGMFGMLSFRNELSANPANTNEQAIVSSVPENDSFSSGEHLSSYTVKVGDVCFVIIGQIVGRPYAAVRYQPSGIFVINSPLREKSLVTRVRRIWSQKNPTQHVLNSLLLDYATRGVSDGKTLNGVGFASPFQCGAAMRLLYYYPSQSSGFVAERLKKLDVRGIKAPMEDSKAQLDRLLQRETQNGVRPVDFVKAVAWCKEPAIIQELANIFTRTSDVGIALETAEVMHQAQPEVVCGRLQEFIAQQPREEMGPFGDGYNLLIKLGQLCATNVKPVFAAYLKADSLQRRRTMCHVLRKTRGEWSIELLAPFLEDKQSANHWTYPVVPGQN